MRERDREKLEARSAEEKKEKRPSKVVLEQSEIFTDA